MSSASLSNLMYGISRKKASYEHQPCHKGGGSPCAVTDQMAFILDFGVEKATIDRRPQEGYSYPLSPHVP